MPTPDEWPHFNLESVVVRELQTNGFEVFKTGYESWMPETMKKRLGQVFTMTALHARTLPDFLAVHKRWQLCFWVECKSGDGRYDNMSVELVPYIQRLAESRLGGLCLYAYADRYGQHGGFWVGEYRPPSRIYLPPRLDYDRGQIEGLVAQWLPAIEIRYGDVGGSRDPFALWLAPLALQPLSYLIQQKLAAFNRRGFYVSAYHAVGTGTAS